MTLQAPRLLSHFIDGAFRPSLSGKTFANIAPATGQKINDVALGDEADIAAAVQAAKKALTGTWRHTSFSERAAVLRRIGDAILASAEKLAYFESLDTGKPISETSKGDIPRSAANFHFFADLCAHQMLPTFLSDDGSWHTTVREPLGVCALITPWNLPLYLATWKLAPALAQGNTVVLKPAELTPMSAFLLGEILQQCDVPAGVVNIVQGFGAGGAGEALVRHLDVKAISFTGETSTGAAIMAASAPTLKKTSFELGGKGASLIFADADLATATKTATRAAFRNQGQICLAGSRLIVEEKIAKEVIDRVREEIQQIVVGDPLVHETTMGSLISFEHRDKVDGYVRLAQDAKEARTVCGGKIPKHLPGAFYEPTLITGVSQESRLIQEEIFGPVLTVQTFKEFAEGLELLNGTPYGLSCSIWSQDIDRAQAAAREARSGLVWINSWFLRNLHTAFGGMKRSGVGREGGQYSLDFFSEMKTISMASRLHPRHV